MQDSKPSNMLEFLKNENDYITYLLEAFEVPETVNSKLTMSTNDLIQFTN